LGDSGLAWIIDCVIFFPGIPCDLWFRLQRVGRLEHWDSLEATNSSQSTSATIAGLLVFIPEPYGFAGAARRPLRDLAIHFWNDTEHVSMKG